MRLAGLIVACWCLFAAPVQADAYPAYTSPYVNDFADVLDEDREAALAGHLAELRDAHDIEMTVVTIRSRDDFDPSDSIEQFATRLFNGWGIGNARRNDGVMVLVAVEDRQMRIELGSGYAPEWDSKAKSIIDHIMIPNFKKGDMLGGIEAGVRTMIARITTNISTTGAATDNPVRVTVSGGGHSDHGASQSGGMVGLSEILWGLVTAVMGGAALFFRTIMRALPRKCERCKTSMTRLDEVTDDSFLDDGSRMEEALNSVDYDVWQCPDCQHSHIERWRNWFSRYGACTSCQFRALESDTTILSSATYSSSGSKRIDYNCRHCGHAYSEVRTIPRKTKSSSSSSSGSSFGGRSSSGGGASGSW